MNPRTTPLVVAIAWLCSLALVFALGILAGGAVLGGGPNLAEDDGGADEYARLIQRLSEQPYEEGQKRLSEAEKAALRQIVTLNMDAETIDMVEHLAAGMPQGHLAEAARFLNTLESGPSREPVFLVFLENWGRADGRSALAFILSDKLSTAAFPAELAVLRGWAGENPEGAFERFQNAGGSLSHRSARIEAIVGSVGQSQPDLALDLVRAIEEPVLRDFALEELGKTVLAAKGGRQSMAWMAALPPFADRDVLIEQTAYAWARQNPLEAARWAGSGNDSALMDAALPRIVEGWATRDPNTAAQWSAGMGPGELRARCLTLAADVWLERASPSALAQWMNTVDKHPDYDGAIEALALASMRQAPRAAFTWALSIEDPEIRNHALVQVGREWLEVEPDAAYDYIAEAPLNRDVQRLLIGEPVEYVYTETSDLELEAGDQVIVTAPASETEVYEEPEMPEGEADAELQQTQ